ncbi:DGQHR domain protein [Tolypothrix tenuis PCC 7101]|uniref:DGQHR domain protein n=1 Tax=Tolypothrix tenuis PCC 7101 TaxID=231146 RepID=A0A1Z4MV37_9CYAN|nr:DGQHR domain-containing protein [Aulosira sp. FACHB-113]BAY97330.1 DGQHR domain protein [Tolypothrix tenuis PCC 7101]BAZ72161.1 DGQHR domain protein [Aulosira laxa NIES-50]
MANVIPAIEARMGSITYYEAIMSARALVSSVRPANESDEWAMWGIEERMQREVDEKRIREEIVPYLAKSPDRFFGSIIVLVYKPEVFSFEPVGTLGKLPAAYSSVARNMGFLTLEGGELIILDGQHRTVALRDIINSKEKPEGEFISEVPSDEVCVIFLTHESNEKTRRIFNKVNRYAKPTSRADNIITSEDDGYAIIGRRLMRKGAPLGGEYSDDKSGRELIVDWKNNTITGRSKKLTTVSVLYETARDILAYEGIRDFDEKTRVRRPSEDELDEAYAHVANWWEDILAEIKPYKEVIDELSKGQSPSCADKRDDEYQYSLLFKPAGQIALVKGLICAVERGLNRKEALRRVNKVDWRTTSDIWTGTIVTASGRMSTGKQSYDLAAELIAYLIGAEYIKDEDIEILKERYNKARGYDYKNQKPETNPEELPQPVSSR